jgi:outer membrane autotransporter protein
VPSITNGVEANNFLLTRINTPTTLSFINATTSQAVAILTTAPVQYVRFYAPPASNQAGAFIVPSNQVRGLTAAQIRDVLALPFVPTMQTLVQVPAGSCLVIGTAGPILTPPNVWGNGGAVQVYLVGRNVAGGCGTGVPGFTGTFFNGQPIGGGALLYGPHVGGGNVGAVAAAFDRGPYPAQFSGMDGLYNTLDGLNAGDPGSNQLLGAALLQLDGEIHASTQTVLLSDSLYLRQALLGRMRQTSFRISPGPASALGVAGPSLAFVEPTEPASRTDYGPGFVDGRQSAAAPRDEPSADGQRFEFWVQGVGAWGNIQGGVDSAGLSHTLGGFFAGIDQHFASNGYVGIAGGYTGSSVSIGDRMSSATINSAHVAGYAGADLGPWSLRGALAASFNTIGTSRAISFPGFSDSLSATYHSTTTQVFSEVGRGLTFGKVAAEPFAGFAYVHLDNGGFSESGNPGIAALNSPGGSTDLGFSTLGLRAAANFEIAGDMVLTPHASIAWQHAYGDVAPTSTVAFVANGASFTTTALPLARDVAVVEAGIDLHQGNRLAFQVTYMGQIASGVQDTWLTGQFRWRF